MKRLVLAAGLAACSGVPAASGLDEPIRVRAATFEAGEMPRDEAAAAITLIESQNGVVKVGAADKHLSGRGSTDTVAVGVALHGLGTGYWVVPVGPPDPTAGNEYTWSIDASIGWELPLGPGAIDLVAIDADGNAGAPSQLDVCITPVVPDNLNACDATIAPPDTVVSLSWDADVDLDLMVRGPDGTIAAVDRDSNAGCRIDSIDRENVVWQDAPPSGSYLVYARLADGCGAASVRFAATVYRADPQGDGTSRLVEVQRQGGQLLSEAAAGGTALFLVQLSL